MKKIKMTLEPKEILYKNFPECKDKEIRFISLRKEKYCDGGYMLNLMIGDKVMELAIGYFNFSFK